MAPSSSLHSSDSIGVAEPEPVLQDSLGYWERQSATYNGVLGVCVVTSHISQLTEASIYLQPGQAAMALVYALFSISQRSVMLTGGSNVVTSPR